MKISLIQPSRNNLKYIKWSYDSIRKNQGDHDVEICVADDFSNDGTWDWCQEMMKKDSNFKAIRNEGPTRLGHTILYDRLINEVASHDACMIYHADMYLCPGAIDSIERYLKDKTIVSLTRIEPPLHPPGPEKIVRDCGIEPEEFDDFQLHAYLADTKEERKDKTTEGIFAPWAFWKKDFQEIGGHDPLFAPQSKEDSDIFNRFQLNGIEFIQTWEGCVYHMTCRGSRFADGAQRNPDGQVFMKGRETDEWMKQNVRSSRNFVRKWGHFVKHDEFLKPIIPPKYNIGIVLENGAPDLLKELEPWCTTIYSDVNDLEGYVSEEQPNTDFDLSKRVKDLFQPPKENDILVEIDGTKFTPNDFMYVQNIAEIIANDPQLADESLPATFQLGNLLICIIRQKNSEEELIICKEKQ